MSNIFGSNFDYGNSPFYKDDGDVPPGGATVLDLSPFEGDIKLFLENGVASASDVRMGDREIERDPGLETSVIISLFTDRRSGDDDKIPDGTDDRRGWWGDALNEAGDADGSLLWLESRAKILLDTPVKLEDYTRAALRWMVEDGVAKEIKIVAARISAVEMALAISIIRPDGTVERFRYARNWDRQIFGKDG